MFIYILVFFLVAFSLVSKNGTIRKNTRWIFYVILPIFISCGYMTGGDWRMYEIDYVSFVGNNSYGRDYGTEYGYTALIKLFKILDVDFWWFTIFSKLIGFYFFIKAYKYYEINKYWGLIFWLPYFAIFLWIDHPARNFIAIIIYSVSLKYIYEKKLIKYLLLCIIAASMHSSAFALIPFYFYINKRSNDKYWIDVACIIVTFFVASLASVILERLPETQMAMRFLNYANSDLDEFQEKMSLGIFALLVSFVGFAIYKIKEIRTYTKYADFIVKCCLVYLFLFATGNLNHILFRLPFFMMLPFTLLITILCELRVKFRKIYVIRCFIICLSFYYMIHLVAKSYQYVPYSNYLQYVFQDKPSYNERSNYNHKNSPYVK